MRLFRVSNALYHTLIVSVINKENKQLSIKLSPDSNHLFEEKPFLKSNWPICQLHDLLFCSKVRLNPHRRSKGSGGGGGRECCCQMTSLPFPPILQHYLFYTS